MRNLYVAATAGLLLAAAAIPVLAQTPMPGTVPGSTSPGTGAITPLPTFTPFSVPSAPGAATNPPMPAAPAPLPTRT